MASTRQIVLRRRAVMNIRKVTRTMEMISTARYKSYYNRWAEGTAFYDALAQAVYLLVTSGEPIEHPLRKENSGPKAAIIAIGSNRGLCGSYNSSVYRLVDVHIKRAKKLGKELDIYAHGKKLVSTLRFRGIEPTSIYADFDETPSDEQVRAMADGFIEQYMNGELSSLSIVYTRFYSVASQHAQTLAILPITELIDDLATRATVISPPGLAAENFYISPSTDEIFDELAKMIVRASIRSCFVEAALSEHLARVVAMRNATENAEEMTKELTAQYNRARQSQITAELLDIIGGVGVIG
jgi:F-type H+-transporting ATPase subunit gamma